MKNLFKLTTAALALVAFASCSNNDLFGPDGAAQAENFSSVLSVEVEEPEGFTSTRAARDVDAKNFTWQKDDAIRVYDEDLAIFDTYKFADKFGRSGATALKKDPKYALFPADDVRKGYWDGTGHIAEVKIGKKVIAGGNQFNAITYDKNSEETVDGKVLYDFQVPMWGPVEKIDDANVKVTGKGLQPLTGVLYLILDETLNNASWIKLTSAKNLSGTFYANLDDEEPVLVNHAEDEYVDLDTELYIDLRKVPSNKTVLYIPVIAGVNDLQVWRTASTGDDPTTLGGWVKFSDQNGYTFKRNGFKKISFSYPMAANTPEALSKVMEQLKAQTEDLDLNLTAALDMSGTLSKKWSEAPADAQGAPDVNIYVPKMAAETVSVNLIKGITTTGKTLTVKDADPTKPFAGTFVINVPDPTGTGAANNSFAGVNINLPNATVVIKGANTKGSVFNTVVAKELQIGDGTTDTDLTASDLAVGNVTSAISVMAKAQVNKLDASGATTTFAPITIKGRVVADVTTKGNVNVELPAEGEAIGGKLTFQRAATVTIKQGYVNDIAAAATLGEADKEAIVVKFDDANGLTAVNTIDPEITVNASTWCKKYPDAATFATYFVANTGNIYTATQLAQAHKALATTLKIANSLDMVNTPDWDEPFVNLAAATAFTMSTVPANAIHTIKNISFNNYKATKLDGKGEAIGFAGNVAALQVSNITFDNVQFTKEYLIDAVDLVNTFAYNAIGGIAGKATTVTLENVTVNLAANFGYSSYKKVTSATHPATIPVDASQMGIGGFVGIASGAVTLNHVSVKGALIQGYTSLGGFIGQAQDAVNIDQTATKASKADITAFKSNYSNPAATDIEMNYARIAAGVGYVNPAAQNVTIGKANLKPTATAATITVPSGKTGRTFVALGSGSGQTLYNYAAGQDWIGFFGTEAFPDTQIGTISINGVTYVVPQKDPANDTKWDAIAAPNLPLYKWTAKN